jgi:hypothetical protein
MSLCRVFSAEDCSPTTQAAPSSVYSLGINVSKSMVEAAEKAGKSKFDANELRASANLIHNLTASSNQSTATALWKAGFVGSPSAPYWQTSGYSHYLMIELKPGVSAKTVCLVVDPNDDSYQPTDVTVSVGQDADALSRCPVHPVLHNFSISAPGQNLLFALLDNEDPSVRFIRVGMRARGQDLRVRGIIVRPLEVAVKPTSPSFVDGSTLSQCLDASLIWMQSITDGVVFELQHEGSCNFSGCRGSQEIITKINAAFKRASTLTHKYTGPTEDKLMRNVRYMCSRNAILRLVPTALLHCWQSNVNVTSCLTAAVADLCSAAIHPANATGTPCTDAFESLILFADNVASTFSLEEIHSTIRHAIQDFIGENLLNAALLQNVFRKCSLSLWGMSCTDAAAASPPPVSKDSVPPATASSSSSIVKSGLVSWRGDASRNEVSFDSSQVTFRDFSTVRGRSFHRHEKHGYYEIEVKTTCVYPQFGFCTPEFTQKSWETMNGCGDDSNSWYTSS